MKKKVLLAGGTGFIGRHLQDQYQSLGYEVLILSRKPGHVQWTDESALIKAMEESALIVNLAGKSVNCRHTAKNKQLLYSSRIDTTRAIGKALMQCKQPPPLWINASTATVYRDSENQRMTEKTGEYGTGFSEQLGLDWEASFFAFSLPKTRQVALRISIVLGRSGGALRPYLNLVKMGFGGPQGTGREMFSWLHIEDLFNIVRFVENTTQLTGPLNTTAPAPVSNRVFMRTLRKIMRLPFRCPLPRFLLRIGALIIGTEPELLLKSRYVFPEKLLESGFQFKFPEIEPALADLLKKRGRFQKNDRAYS